MAYVDAEKLKRNIRVNLMPNIDIDGTVTVENAERYFLNLIDKTTTADVVEVVRCKDCKHYCLSDFRKPEEHRWCEQICNGDYYPEPTDFCSYGERKDDK